jgi:hypothetical protein
MLIYSQADLRFDAKRTDCRAQPVAPSIVACQNRPTSCRDEDQGEPAYPSLSFMINNMWVYAQSG